MSVRDNLPRLPDQASAFIVLFARFEYAARRAGWYRGTESLISWGKVADAFTQAFFDEVKDAIPELRKSPPKDLMLVGGAWQFPPESPPELRSTVELFKAVAQVRNNLLHGEKPYWSGRDQQLIAEAAEVLDRAFSWARAQNLPIMAHVYESRGGGTP